MSPRQPQPQPQARLMALPGRWSTAAASEDSLSLLFGLAVCVLMRRGTAWCVRANLALRFMSHGPD